MGIIYLPIRSFGDFIITASVVKKNFKSKIPIVLPEYMLDIFYAVSADAYFEVYGIIPFKNQPAFFEFYTVRNISNLRRLLKDISVAAGVLSRTDLYLLDYRSRRLFFTLSKFAWPSPKSNIYEGKMEMLAANGLISSHNKVNQLVAPVNPHGLRILILPDSRIRSKEIPRELVERIAQGKPGRIVNTAVFAKMPDTSDRNLHYSNFSELILLINTHNLIISAESLPYHLANYFNKPHFVIYRQSRHFKSEFMTPFMERYKAYSVFTGINEKKVLTDLDAAIITIFNVGTNYGQ